jgi:hypothetical protein
VKQPAWNPIGTSSSSRKLRDRSPSLKNVARNIMIGGSFIRSAGGIKGAAPAVVGRDYPAGGGNSSGHSHNNRSREEDRGSLSREAMRSPMANNGAGETSVKASSSNIQLSRRRASTATAAAIERRKATLSAGGGKSVSQSGAVNNDARDIAQLMEEASPSQMRAPVAV